VKHFLLLGEIFKQSLDLTSAIYALRYALRLKPEYVKAKKKLYELLCLSGVELMGQAQSDTGENVSSSLFRYVDDC
jgi:cytochrome c-type biogenesis protein CcmH/NrfG